MDSRGAKNGVGIPCPITQPRTFAGRPSPSNISTNPARKRGSAGILPAGSGFQPELLDMSGRQIKGWTNKLIFGNDTMTLVPATVG